MEALARSEEMTPAEEAFVTDIVDLVERLFMTLVRAVGTVQRLSAPSSVPQRFSKEV